MLDLALQVLRDVVSMSYVTDASHWHRDHELVRKGGQLALEKTDNVQVALIIV